MMKLGFGIVAALFLVGLSTRAYQAIQTKAVEEVVQRSEKEGAARAKKSAKAHDAARAPGAADRLFKDPASCRDCR